MSYVCKLIRSLFVADATIIMEIRRMSEALDNLTAKVAAQETVEASAITLLQTIKSELDAALSSGDADALNALSARLDTDTQNLAAAVAANTPAAPAAPAA